MVAGVTTYGFLVVSARALGPERYSSLSALWALVVLAAPGMFLPLEQEVARALSARHALGLGGRPVVAKAALAGGAVATLLVIASLASSGPALDHLFDRDGVLLAALALALVAYFAGHLFRGTLSGTGRFRSYGIAVGAEGVIRLAISVVLALFSVRSAGLYGLAIGLALLTATGIVLRSERNILVPGPEASWSELSAALGYLLAGSLLAQALMNAGPIAVKLLAPESEQAAAGRFLAGLVIARIPVFLFQAVQAALLPKLSGLAASGRHAHFRTGLKQLMTAVALIGIASTSLAFAVGPWVVRTFFGEGFGLARADLTYLAAASAAFMVAIALAQALIALRGHARVALSWLTGVSVFLVVVAIQPGLLLRVEQGFLAGSAMAAIVMGILLVPRIREARGFAGDLIQAAREIPIEP
jgi:O-antigen/teichoic acid export membrane protein